MSKRIKHVGVATALIASAAGSASRPALALEQIIRPYQSARSAGMGGVRITTGMYDENFFSNPARVTSDPKWKFSLVDIMAETTSNTLDAVSDLTGSGDVLNKIASKSGKNMHGRIQTAMPAVYLPNIAGRNSLAIGLISSTQFDVDLRNSYSIQPNAVTDLGPAIMMGRKFLPEEALSVGLTTHATYRLATKSGFSFVDLIKGASLSPLQSGGEGAHIDFDLGGTYNLPFKPMDFNLSTGASVNNILGGNYSNLKIHLAKTGLLPPQQPRSYNLGIAARKPELWKFTDSVFALELTDIGNNPDGSFFRLVHLGGEVRYGVLAPRLGLNQGYISAGLGFYLKVFELDFATYGEEMSLNVGETQDRRYAVRIAFQI